MKFKDIEEVSEVCQKEGRRYLVYNNSVLDCSNFKHPGPSEFITDNIGKDVTQLFDD